MRSDRPAGGGTLSTMHAVPPVAVMDDRACIRVLIVEAHPIVRWALSRMTDRERDLNCVGSAEGVDDAVPMIEAQRPDVITLAIETNHVPMEINRLPELRRLYPSLGIVVLASEPDDDLLFQALEHGASAFVIKRAPVDEILSAVRHA